MLALPKKAFKAAIKHHQQLVEEIALKEAVNNLKESALLAGVPFNSLREILARSSHAAFTKDGVVCEQG